MTRGRGSVYAIDMNEQRMTEPRPKRRLIGEMSSNELTLIIKANAKDMSLVECNKLANGILAGASIRDTTIMSERWV